MTTINNFGKGIQKMQESTKEAINYEAIKTSEY